MGGPPEGRDRAGPIRDCGGGGGLVCLCGEPGVLLHHGDQPDSGWGYQRLTAAAAIGPGAGDDTIVQYAPGSGAWFDNGRLCNARPLPTASAMNWFWRRVFF